MKKRNFFTGSVFQFYIPEIKKYAFCKFFDFRQISSFHGLLAQVYETFSDREDNNLDDLKFSEPLFGHRSMHAWPDLRNGTGWKYLGILNAKGDNIIPDFKEVQAFKSVVEDESSIGPWYPVHQLTKRGAYCDYKLVSHLERKILTTTSLCIPCRSGMEFCRINGLQLKDHYDLSNEGNKKMYYQMINTPRYKDIPEEIRGKALV